MQDIGFDPSSVKKTSFEPIPAGDYFAEIVKTDLTQNKDKDNDLTSAIVNYQVIGGDFDGRLIFARYAIAAKPGPDLEKNAKRAKAVQIGQELLAQMMQAVAVGGRDLSQCVGKRLTIGVKVRPANGNFPTSNDVAKCRPATGAAAAPAENLPF